MIASKGRMPTCSSSFALATRAPLAFAQLERLERALRQIDEPQMLDAFAGIDGALVVQLQPAPRVREYLAHPIRP